MNSDKTDEFKKALNDQRSDARKQRRHTRTNRRDNRRNDHRDDRRDDPRDYHDHRRRERLRRKRKKGGVTDQQIFSDYRRRAEAYNKRHENDPKDLASIAFTKSLNNKMDSDALDWYHGWGLPTGSANDNDPLTDSDSDNDSDSSLNSWTPDLSVLPRDHDSMIHTSGRRLPSHIDIDDWVAETFAIETTDLVDHMVSRARGVLEQEGHNEVGIRKRIIQTLAQFGDEYASEYAGIDETFFN